MRAHTKAHCAPLLTLQRIASPAHDVVRYEGDVVWCGSVCWAENVPLSPRPAAVVSVSKFDHVSACISRASVSQSVRLRTNKLHSTSEFEYD